MSNDYFFLQHSGILFIADYDITRKHDYYHWSTIETTGIVTTDDTTPPDDRPVDELPDCKRSALYKYYT